MKIFPFLSLLFLSSAAHSYPEFIGYGYNTCMACHYNGAGGGGLTDYGRALSASELSGKGFWSKTSDEELAETSGFLGRKETPFWFKPGLKYRRLLNQLNPGAKDSVVRDYTMQLDLNLASFTSDEMDKGVVVTLSHAPTPQRAAPNDTMSGELMAKEYYLRWGLSNGDWLSIGMLDKPFGIRHPDHTAVNRSPLRLGQNDQVHGIQWHRPHQKRDLFVFIFAGNTHLSQSERNQGLSVVFEEETQSRFRPGASVKYETGELQTSTQLAGHLRWGIEKGHALLTEFGLKQAKAPGFQTTTGFYHFFELSYLLRRGYHFQSIVQLEKGNFAPDSPEVGRWGFGLLALPMHRLEFRLQALHSRVRAPNLVEDGQWIAQAQLHLYL